MYWLTHQRSSPAEDCPRVEGLKLEIAIETTVEAYTAAHGPTRTRRTDQNVVGGGEGWTRQ
jgi:hypothetical protein